MARSTRPDYHIDLEHLPPLVPSQTLSATSTATSSPIEPPSTSNSRLPSTNSGGLGGVALPSVRLGAGSPSHEHGSRFYPRRARELAASSGTHQTWGPPTASGLSTPLRETIPESPDDTFPDLGIATPTLEVPGQSSAVRRARAGTVPSRFPPGTFSPAQSVQPIQQKSSRATPSTSPFRSGSVTPADTSNPNTSQSSTSASANASALLSRFRAGSMPQRSLLSTQSPFGPSVFSSSWSSSRGRASTLSGQLEDPVSPPRPFRKDSLLDTDIRTLDYLGLVDPSPQSATADTTGLDLFALHVQDSNSRPLLANPILSRIPNSRFRSYSVNAKEKYALVDDDEEAGQSTQHSGTLTPSAEAAAQALAVTQAQIHQHNLDVQAFAHQASSSRPRARTAGLLDSPSSRFWRSYAPSPSRLDNTVFPSDIDFNETDGFDSLNQAVQALQLQPEALPASSGVVINEGATDEEVTRALWLGNIPASTTPSSLKVLFEAFGRVESARVLTHKNCGFVNYETIDSAARAKSQLNGKEIFPGAGPIRIGYAKAPSSLVANGMVSSPSPVPFGLMDTDTIAGASLGSLVGMNNLTDNDQGSPDGIYLRDVHVDLLDIVRDFGASHEEQTRIAAMVEQAIHFDTFVSDIPAVSEPSQARVHDAPRLREIRKRIDNNSCTQAEIEEIALSMLPEIVELSSDYLGNTVVQKLFEFCSEPLKEAMLQKIAPHLAEIGVHKNGTWAAQKIIDVARTPLQMSIIVDSLRPYAVASFLDQYGNYVMQCCLRFQAPWNNFLFEVMLSRLWDIAQGRFGARAMRASLESHHATKDQQKMLAAAIALNSVSLATSPNGALLLTWYLDTCTFPNRRRVLVPRLILELVHLCTHKVAYLTILKVINQRNEPEAREMLLQALFFSQDDQALLEILKDQTCGATLIFKLLTTPFIEETVRNEVVQKVRSLLLQLKAQPSQGYKRLMDEVGLTTRGSGLTARDQSHTGRDKSDGSRPSSKHDIANPSGSLATPAPSSQPNGNYFSPMQAQPQMQFHPNGNFHPQINGGMPMNGGYDQYAMVGLNATNSQHYSPNQNVPSQATGSPQNQLQYQVGRTTGMYNINSPILQGFSGQMPQLMNPYQNGPRTHMMGSPQAFPMGPGSIIGQPGFSPHGAYNPMMGMGGSAPGIWPQYPNSYMVPHQQMQGQGQGQAMMGDGRRGRVST